MKFTTSLLITFLALTALLGEAVLYSVPIFSRSVAHATEELPGVSYLFKSLMGLTALTAVLAPVSVLLERLLKRRHLSYRLMISTLFLATFVLLVYSPPFNPPEPGTPKMATLSRLPRYDTEKFCRSFAGLTGEGVKNAHGDISHAAKGDDAEATDRYNACIDEEQRSYYRMKERQLELSTKTIERCDKVAKPGESGSYSLLKSCLEQSPTGEKTPVEKHFVY